MVSDMILFFEGLLSSVATFLGSEPIIYFVGTIALLIVIKALRALIY